MKKYRRRHWTGWLLWLLSVGAGTVFFAVLFTRWFEPQAVEKTTPVQPSLNNILKGIEGMKEDETVRVELSAAELAALLSSNAGGFAEDIKISYPNDNKISLSFIMKDRTSELLEWFPQLKDYEFLLKLAKNAKIALVADVTVGAEEQFEIKLEEVKVASLSLSKDMYSEPEAKMNEAINTTLGSIQGLEIEKLAIRNNKLVFSGKLPAEFKGFIQNN